jgi:hypothetical protein
MSHIFIMSNLFMGMALMRWNSSEPFGTVPGFMMTTMSKLLLEK